ncbi:guanine nucleotide binding protein, alpha subunit, partial [Pholiota conissans]
MGGCISQPDKAGKERSDEIDRTLEEDNKKFKRDCKILLLGSGESGKTTIVKQMKIIHQDGFSEAELAEYRPAIYKNVLDSANAVVVHMKKIGLECVEFTNRPLAEKIIDHHFDLQNRPPFVSTEIAEAIHQLWKDPIITKIMDEHSSEFYLMD